MKISNPTNETNTQLNPTDEDLKNAISSLDLGQIEKYVNPSNINAQDKDGYTALMVAARYSRKDENKLVEKLISYGADVNLVSNKGWTALMLSVRCTTNDSMIETAKMLLDNGADPNIQERDGESALTLALTVLPSSIETIRLLLENGANTRLRTINDVNAMRRVIDISAKPGQSESVRTQCKTVIRMIAEWDRYPYYYLHLGPLNPDHDSIISGVVWARINRNINLQAEQYSRSGNFRLPKDVWRLILLRNKWNQLNYKAMYFKYPHNRINPYNILVHFARMLNLDSTNVYYSFEDLMSLSRLISKQLSWGGPQTEQSVNYFKKQAAKKHIRSLAEVLGVNLNQHVDKILEDIVSKHREL